MNRPDTPQAPDGAAGLDPAAVCTLSPDGLDDRLTWIRREIVPHAVFHERLDRGLAFELVAAPGSSEALDRLIALERQCCSSIVFERKAGTAPGRLRLEIHGVDPSAAVFRSGVEAEDRPPERARWLRAAAAGLLASAFVCCIVPVAAISVLGAAAAPLAALDTPAALVAGAVAAGGGAWWWLGRRARRTAREASPGCGTTC